MEGDLKKKKKEGAKDSEWGGKGMAEEEVPQQQSCMLCAPGTPNAKAAPALESSLGP